MVAKLTAVLIIAFGLAVAGAPAIPETAASAAHVLSRLGYGPRPGEIERVQALGVAAWIDQQLHPEGLADDALAARLAPLTTLALGSQTITQDYDRPAVEERRRRQRENAGAPEAAATPPSGLPERDARPAPSEAERKNRQVMTELEDAKVLRAVYSDRQLEAVLTDFWFNHFNVFAGKGPTRNYVTEFERDVIRPHVFGRFRDLLGATAASPAMLFYLDNWENVDPKAGQRAAEARAARVMRGARPGNPRLANPGRLGPVRPLPAAAGDKDAAKRPPRGLNENYARELMELHTLGVDGGYTQKDIVEVARAFTGWTMRPREGSGFMFVAALHDPGAKTVLGHTIRAGGGRDDAEQVLDLLAAHSSTARFIARKLVQRFVSDEPPAALVDRAASRFLATKGDLREVVRVIVTSPEFFAPAALQAKTKTPFEFVVSALRATDADVQTAQPLARTLRELGMPLYLCQPPTGYDDTAATWTSPGALVTRVNFALALGQNRVRGVRVPPGAAGADAAATLGSPEFQRR